MLSDMIAKSIAAEAASYDGMAASGLLNAETGTPKTIRETVSNNRSIRVSPARIA
jgi:hypothetical protein